MKCLIDKDYFYIPILFKGVRLVISERYCKKDHPRIDKLGKNILLREDSESEVKIWLRFRCYLPASEEAMLSLVENQGSLPFVREKPEHADEVMLPDLNLTKLRSNEENIVHRILGIYGTLTRDTHFLEYD